MMHFTELGQIESNLWGCNMGQTLLYAEKQCILIVERIRDGKNCRVLRFRLFSAMVPYIF